MSMKPKKAAAASIDAKYERVSEGCYVRRSQPSSGKLTDKQFTDNIKFLLRKAAGTSKTETVAETATGG